jgi:hypothetical protein
MNRHAALALCWTVLVIVVGLTVYITKNGWWLIILAIISLEFGDEENDNKGSNNSARTS